MLDSSCKITGLVCLKMKDLSNAAIANGQWVEELALDGDVFKGFESGNADSFKSDIESYEKMVKEKRDAGFVVSDYTRIASFTWGDLKEYAMQDNYQQQAWFVSIISSKLHNKTLFLLLVISHRQGEAVA